MIAPAATLRPLTRADLPAVAAVHMRAFPDGAITALGQEAASRYYEWLLGPAHDATCMGAFVSDRLVGFLCAGRFNGALSGFLRKHRVYLTLHIATHLRLLASPLVRDRLRIAARSLAPRRPRATPGDKDAPPAPRSFGILAIAVDPTVQGSGAGRLLMDHADRTARQRDYRHMHLTVNPANVHAVGFYEHLGWTRQPEPDGAFAGRMHKTFDAEDPS